MKNKEKYILNEIVIETADTLNGHKVEIFYKGKIIYERIYLVETSPKKIADFFNWLEQEYKPPILDDVEKTYLSSVIKPFRNEVECIVKYMFSEEKEFLAICLYNGEEITLPIFIRRTMYKGMKSRKEYTLKELGL